MSNIYPTLEDLKVDQLVKAQGNIRAPGAEFQLAPGSAPYPPPNAPPMDQSFSPSSGTIYPCLNDYMGLSISHTQNGSQPNGNLGLQLPANQGLAVRMSQASQMIAPITGRENKGLIRSEIKGGVRQIVLCKDIDGRLGLRVQAVNKGIFVAFVMKDSPASLVGLRFGDQILDINGTSVAGWSTDQTFSYLKKIKSSSISMVIRDRPFERILTMQKDSAGYVGFVFKDGKITSIVKDSSAARNGLLTDHQLIEINGQNVVGLKDKQIQALIDQEQLSVTVTIMPSFVFDHVMKHIGWSLVKKGMDHSIPEL